MACQIYVIPISKYCFQVGTLSMFTMPPIHRTRSNCLAGQAENADSSKSVSPRTSVLFFRIIHSLSGFHFSLQTGKE